MPLRTIHFPAPIQGQSEVNGVDVTQHHARRLTNFIPDINNKIRRRPPLQVCAAALLSPEEFSTEDIKTIRLRVDNIDWALVFARDMTGRVGAVAHEVSGSCRTAPVVITGDAQPYLNAAGRLDEDLEGRTLNETSYIWNRNVETANLMPMDDDTSLIPSGNRGIAVLDTFALSGQASLIRDFASLEPAARIGNTRSVYTLEADFGFDTALVRLHFAAHSLANYDLPPAIDALPEIAELAPVLPADLQTISFDNPAQVGGQDGFTTVGFAEDTTLSFGDYYAAEGAERVEYLLDSNDVIRYGITGISTSTPGAALVETINFSSEAVEYGGVTVTSDMSDAGLTWRSDGRYIVISQPFNDARGDVTTFQYREAVSFHGELTEMVFNVSTGFGVGPTTSPLMTPVERGFLAPTLNNPLPSGLITAQAVGTDLEGILPNTFTTPFNGQQIPNAGVAIGSIFPPPPFTDDIFDLSNLGVRPFHEVSSTSVRLTPFNAITAPTLLTLESADTLPLSAPPSIVFTVTNGSTDPLEHTLFAFDPTVGNSGAFVEVLSSSATDPNSLDQRRMPVGATFDGTTWTIDILPWQQRSLGANPELIPDPDFLGSAVRDLSLFRGRLCLLYSDGVALSDISNDLGFYPLSEATTTDGDPIFLTNTLDEDTIFHWLVPFNRRLLVLAQDAILEITALSGILTPDTVDMRNLTEHPVSNNFRAFAVSGYMFFGTDTEEDNNNLNLSEFNITLTRLPSALAETAVADTTTLLNPSLLQGRVFSVANLPALFSTLYCPSEGNRAIYHTYRQVQGRRVQNAFSEIILPEELSYISAIPLPNSFGIHYRDSVGNVHYGALNMQELSTGFFSSSQLYSDSQVLNPPRVVGTGETAFTLPFSVTNDTEIVALLARPSADLPEGWRFTTTIEDGQIIVHSELPEEDIVIGIESPPSVWLAPEPFLFEARDRTPGVPALSIDSLCMRGVVGLIGAGGATVSTNGECVYEYEQDTYGVTDSLFDSSSLFTGQEIFLVGEELRDLTIEVSSANHNPLSVNFLTLHVRLFGRA